MTSLPHHYTSTITRVGHSHAELEAPPRPVLEGGPPPELQGDPARWSPEHLLVSALGLCLFTTFEAFARRERLEVLGWRETVTGVLDRTMLGVAFTGFTIDVDLDVADGDVDRARDVLARAKRHCIISRAVVAPITIEPRIRGHQVRARVA